MKKIIRADRLEDIRKDRESYNQKKKAYDDAREQAWENYLEAQNIALSPIREYVEKKLQPYTAILDLEVNVERAFGTQIRCNVKCNDRNHFDDNSALSWNYDVTFSRDGKVEKETGSWSGLKATTPEQMHSLQATVMALQTLNSIDWEHVMNVELPKSSDYDVKEEEPTPEYDYDAEEAKEVIKALIGTHKGIEVHNKESFGYRVSPKHIYAFIVSETPGMCKIITVTDFTLHNADSRKRIINMIDNGMFEQQVRKSTLEISKPIKIVDLDSYNNEED